MCNDCEKQGLPHPLNSICIICLFSVAGIYTLFHVIEHERLIHLKIFLNGIFYSDSLFCLGNQKQNKFLLSNFTERENGGFFEVREILCFSLITQRWF